MNRFLMLVLAASASLFVSGAWVSTAQAKPNELKGLVASASPAGCANYRYLVFNLYRAELWSDSKRLPGAQYGLSLTYRSDFSREELVDASIDEMARMTGRSESSFASVRRQLNAVFRNVKEGDRITAFRDSAKRVRFFHNGRATGSLTRNAGLFMDIWLGPKARFDRRRDVMLSGRCSA